jgi:hypothetical protein
VTGPCGAVSPDSKENAVCESGINVDQLKLSIAQVEGSLALAQQKLEQLHRLADHGRQHDASTAMAQVTVMLGEARDRLDGAADALDGSTPGPDVTVELV